MKEQNPTRNKIARFFLCLQTVPRYLLLFPCGRRRVGCVSKGASWGLFIFALLMITGTVHAGGTMNLTKAVIHHTADKDTNRDQTVEQIDAYHKSKGWDGIGYHFLIRKDGKIYNGRPIWKKGAHAGTGRPYSRNHYIGIALTGYDLFTIEQVDSLKALLMNLQVKQIERHHEECPGPGLDVEKIQKDIK